jgi:hypothetical protein
MFNASEAPFSLAATAVLTFAEDPDAWIVFDQFSMLSGKETVTRDDLHNFTVSF